MGLFDASGSGSYTDANSDFRSGSTSDYVYGQQVDPFSQQMQQDLWGQAMRLYGNADPWNIAGNAYRRMDASMPGSGARLDAVYDATNPNWQRMAGGGAFRNPWEQGQGGLMSAQQQLMANPQAAQLQDAILQGSQGPSNTAMMYQDIVGGPGNTYIDPMVDAMRGDYGDMFREEFLPSVAVNAVNTGNLGSSRQDLAQAVGGAEMAENFARDAINLRGQAYDTDLNWKMDIAKLADQSQQQNLDRMYNMWDAGNLAQQAALDRQGGYGSGADATSMWGIGAAPGMSDLALSKLQMNQNMAMLPWQPLSYMSQFTNQYRPVVTEQGYGSADAWNRANSSFNTGNVDAGFSFL